MTTPVARSACGYIDGVWVTGDGEPFDVVNPSTEDTLATVPSMTVPQADRAVAVARRAFDGGEWSRVPAAERAERLHHLADLMERDTDRLVQLIVGRDRYALLQRVARPAPLPDPEPALVRGRGSRARERRAALATADDGRARHLSTWTTRQPIGVVVGLAAYNYPRTLLSGSSAACSWRGAASCSSARRRPS